MNPGSHANPPRTEATVQSLRSRYLPAGWLAFTDAHPSVANVASVAGLVAIMFLLAPSVVNPTAHGSLVDTFSTIVPSDTLTAKIAGLRTMYHAAVPGDVRDYTGAVIANPALYLLIPFVLLLEFLFPADRSQPILGKGFWQDAVWFVASAPTKVLVLGTLAHVLRQVYDQEFAFLTIHAATAWPLALQVLAAVVVGEFLNWASHFVRHKVETLWNFHAVHHSQKALNVFTDDRQHVMDRLVSSVLMFVPAYMFQVPNLYAVAVIALWISIHSRFVHANAKVNFGWLGWVFSSPQFHRVHHSVDPAHWDCNYGGVISAFDHLFGTAYPSSTIYPDTGIADPRFPDEDKLPVSQLARNWCAQTAYPFRQMAAATTRTLRTLRTQRT